MDKLEPDLVGCLVEGIKDVAPVPAAAQVPRHPHKTLTKSPRKLYLPTRTRPCVKFC